LLQVQRGSQMQNVHHHHPCVRPCLLWCS
jgi:hypothetical protein